MAPIGHRGRHVQFWCGFWVGLHQSPLFLKNICKTAGLCNKDRARDPAAPLNISEGASGPGVGYDRQGGQGCWRSNPPPPPAEIGVSTLPLVCTQARTCGTLLLPTVMTSFTESARWAGEWWVLGNRAEIAAPIQRERTPVMPRCDSPDQLRRQPQSPHWVLGPAR